MLVLERLGRPATPIGQGEVAHPPLALLATALLDRIEGGLAACDSCGHVLYANRAARREFAECRVLLQVEGRLRDAAGVQGGLAAALVDATARHRSTLLWVGRAPSRLMIVVTPSRIAGFDSSTALVLLGQRNLCSPLGLEMLSLQSGLTMTEQRVLRALIGDQSPRDIAKTHGVALATIRTQIQAIREKVGVRTIDALLLHVAQVPLVSVCQ